MDSRTTVPIQHVVTLIKRPFAEACSRFESRLEKLDYSEFQRILNERELATARSYIKEKEGPLGLMIFSIIDHGSLLILAGQSAQAKQYVVGNPLFALQMTSHDIRAGLYAPLRIYIREEEMAQSAIEYDLPSSLFGQFGNQKVDAVARMLDEHLNAAIDYVQGV